MSGSAAKGVASVSAPGYRASMERPLRCRVKRMTSRLLGAVVLCAVAACGVSPPVPSTPTPTSGATAEPGAVPAASPVEPTASAPDDRHPVPARVADVHRSFFEPTDAPIPGGIVHCLITLHDGRLPHDEFYAVALFGGGQVATWVERPTGRAELFVARLTPEEDGQARRWLEEVAAHRDAAHDRFPPSTTVLGLSTRRSDRLETSYFASGDAPVPLERLVQLLKSRLEATNAP